MVSGAGRAGGKGFPAFLDRVPIYTPLSAPTPPPGRPTLPHARIPTAPGVNVLQTTSSHSDWSPNHRAGPRPQLQPGPHYLPSTPPCLQGTSGKPLHSAVRLSPNCPIHGTCLPLPLPFPPERRLLEGRGSSLCHFLISQVAAGHQALSWALHLRSPSLGLLLLLRICVWRTHFLSPSLCVGTPQSSLLGPLFPPLYTLFLVTSCFPLVETTTHVLMTVAH